MEREIETQNTRILFIYTSLLLQANRIIAKTDSGDNLACPTSPVSHNEKVDNLSSMFA